MAGKDADGEFAAAEIPLGNHAGVETGSQFVGRAQFAGALDLADADAGALVRRLDEKRQAEARFGSGEVAGGIQHEIFRYRQPRCLPDQLGTPLVHRQGGGQHAAAGVGKRQQVERALQRAVLAAASVQGDEDALETLGVQRFERLVPRVEAVGIDAAGAQGGQHRGSAFQRNLALGRLAAHHHRHLAEIHQAPSLS